MARVTVNGVRLGYDEAGTGPAVVLAHAGIADRRMWDHQFAHLGADHRVIRHDWRGMGESDDAAGRYSHHRDLLGLLDALDVERAALVGCSMGGTHALDVALAAPQRVTALALIGAVPSGYRPTDEAVAGAQDRVRRAVPAQRLEAYRAHQGEPVREQDVTAMARVHAELMVAGPGRDPAAVDPQVWRAALTMLEGVFRRDWAGPPATEESPDPPAVGRLGEVRVPTLVVNGLADMPWIQEVAGLLADGIPGARRIDLPDTGHLPSVERPEATTGALRAFLGS